MEFFHKCLERGESVTHYNSIIEICLMFELLSCENTIISWLICMGLLQDMNLTCVLGDKKGGKTDLVQEESSTSLNRAILLGCRKERLPLYMVLYIILGQIFNYGNLVVSFDPMNTFPSLLMCLDHNICFYICSGNSH